MPRTEVPTTRDLRNLSLRAAIALALRATQRVAQLLPNRPNSKDTASSNLEERVFHIGNLLVKSFCDGTLHRDSTRLAEIMADTKWEPRDENSPEIADPVLRTGDYTFSATMQARFGHSVEEELPTFSTAQDVIDLVQKSLTAALAASVAAGEHYRSAVLEGISRDFRSLQPLSTAVFPEYGPTIDTTLDGPLGDLWHGPPPRVASAPQCENARVPADPDLSHATTAAYSAAGDGSPPDGYLYKYVTFQTLIKVLENTKLRFSRVARFNDPFDGQLLPIRKFGWKQFFTALRNETSRIAGAKDEPIFELPEEIPADAAISAAAQLVKEFLDNGGRTTSIFPKTSEGQETVEPLSKLLRPMIYLAQQGKLGSNEQALSSLNSLLDLFEHHRLPFSLNDADRRMIPALADIIQVLCLTEVPDSLLMWSHYADCHSGAVLKFDTCSNGAGYFSAARPVIYEKQLPGIEQPRDLVRRYLGLASPETDWMSRQFFTKGAEWAYEKEWRIMATSEMRKQGEFISFPQESLSAIYLGCRVTTENIRNVLDLVVDKRYPTDVYVTVKDETEFALSFVPVSNGRTRGTAIPKMATDERARLYRRCLDVYFEFWNDPTDDLRGARRRLRAEGSLADYGPPGSRELFREMITKLEETAASHPRIAADRGKEPEEYKRQYLRILKPSAEAYGALEDTLKKDLAARGGTLPDCGEPDDMQREKDAVSPRGSAEC